MIDTEQNNYSHKNSHKCHSTELKYKGMHKIENEALTTFLWKYSEISQSTLLFQSAFIGVDQYPGNGRFKYFMIVHYANTKLIQMHFNSQNGFITFSAEDIYIQSLVERTLNWGKIGCIRLSSVLILKFQ